MSKQPTTSAFRRFVKLGGLAGRVGASVVSEKVRDLGRDEKRREAAKTESLLRNAARMAETLGELKGAAMKLGQMLSLHEGLLPKEVSAVLRSLQKEAPSVPAEVMEYEVKGQLPNYDDLFEYLDLEPFAAASIGQVHRARLRDGREVAVKIQYPAIDHIIKADLKNFRRVLGGIFSLFSTADFEPIWVEVRDRLMEEIDYRQEAENLQLAAELYADMPEIVIPKVIPEASAGGVLTMEFVAGMSGEEACSEAYDQELRNQWGKVLLVLLCRGLFVHRFLHADPNLANFGFLADGRVIAYDFGCIKRPPEKLVVGYSGLVHAVLEERWQDIPKIAFGMGVQIGDGEPVPFELVDPYLQIFGQVLRDDPPYTFGEDRELYDKLMELGMENLDAARDLRFPEDVVFIDRCFSGHFGNLTKFQATGPWREVAAKYAALAAPVPA